MPRRLQGSPAPLAGTATGQASQTRIHCFLPDSGISVGTPARHVGLTISTGGEGGIRTPDTLSGMPVFKTGAINHSATSPWLLLFYYRQHFTAAAMPAKRRIANRTRRAGLDCAVVRPRHSLLTSVRIIPEPCCVIDRRDPCTSLQWQVGVTTIQETAHRVRFR